MELRVEGVHKKFNEKQVLHDISFSVSSGQALGLLGRNGAGKTTTLRILTDIFQADSGEIRLNGAPIDRGQINMGYLPEERGLYPKSKVGEQMIYIGRLKGLSADAAKKRAMDLLEELEAAEHWSKKLETLSKGNQQKIQLAIAVIQDPEIIILDEPFSGLDPVNAKILKQMISRQADKDKIVIFSSHQMPYVEEFCQHICILNKGRIVLDGLIREIRKTWLRNRIAVSPEEDPDIFLARAARHENWPRVVTQTFRRGETLEIILKDPADKQCLYTLLAELDTGIDSFSVVEPTLEEIFVRANEENDGEGGGVHE